MVEIRMQIGWLLVLVVCCISTPSSGLLYPSESESREVKDLSGRWRFVTDNSTGRNEGFLDKWWSKPLTESSNRVIDMPVPASYNDITQDREIRDFVGWAWYETTFRVPKAWNNDGSLVWLRVGSAHYYSIVWVNGKEVMQHEGGHLPFEADISGYVEGYGALNRLTIAVNNTLTLNTLPPGFVQYHGPPYPPHYFTLNFHFDFFNYAGIHRPVQIYSTPACYTKSIVTHSEVTDDNHAQVSYNVTTAGDCSGQLVNVELQDASGRTVSKSQQSSGKLAVARPNLWWPVGMNASVGYMYTLVVRVSQPVLYTYKEDVYRLRVGIRTVTVDGTRFLINGRPFYFLGVGKHEDWIVRGKGFDWASVIKDFNLLDWLGANSFRTSHYPYSEEIMRMCDERGIVVIDECPAVGMIYGGNFVNKTLRHHYQVMSEMIERDRNHPSVVMWSVANEPKSDTETTSNYFKSVLDYTRSLDATRPATFVCNRPAYADRTSEHVDVIALNNYDAWYADYGHTELIVAKVTDYLQKWNKKLSKPIIITEYGAGAIAGFHSSPAVMYSEDFEVELLAEHFKVFHSMRTLPQPYLTGSMVWNFADFATGQEPGRAYGNRKGLFTRDRQPKSAAHLVRHQYLLWRNQSSWCDARAEFADRYGKGMKIEKVAFVRP